MSCITFEIRILEVAIFSLELNVDMCHSYCCHICGAVISGWCPLYTLYLTTQSGRHEHGEGTPQPHEKTGGCHRLRCTRKLEVVGYEDCVKESGEFHGTVQWPGYVYLREMNKMKTSHLLGECNVGLYRSYGKVVWWGEWKLAPLILNLEARRMIMFKFKIRPM